MPPSFHLSQCLYLSVESSVVDCSAWLKLRENIPVCAMLLFLHYPPSKYLYLLVNAGNMSFWLRSLDFAFLQRGASNCQCKGLHFDGSPGLCSLHGKSVNAFFNSILKKFWLLHCHLIPLSNEALLWHSESEKNRERGRTFFRYSPQRILLSTFPRPKTCKCNCWFHLWAFKERRQESWFFFF